MSLRVFHIIFMVFCILLCIGFGGWSITEYARNGEAAELVWGIVGLLCAVGLIAYAVRAVKKFKTLNTSSHIALKVMAVVLVMSGCLQSVQACPSCYGDASSPAAEGMNAAIFLLLGITGGVFTGIAAFGIRMRRRMRSLVSEVNDLHNSN